MSVCQMCPRRCGADRANGALGYCGVSATVRIARAALHMWEEPVISGTRGSGTIFFCGCNLQCVYCQNKAISRGQAGRELSADHLERVMLRLAEAGAHNLNLVTPTHYARQLIPVLERVRSRISIPVVYNCGGYESVQTLRMLDGLVDIYLPDLKYFDPQLSARYSGAPDYFEVASAALGEMLRQTGAPQIGDDGLLQKGVVVRHLVLPSCRKDSIALLRSLAEQFGANASWLSLMRQYTPEFALDTPYPELHRRVTSFEYESVRREAIALGFEGCMQDRTAATSDYTPDFYQTSFLDIDSECSRL